MTGSGGGEGSVMPGGSASAVVLASPWPANATKRLCGCAGDGLRGDRFAESSTSMRETTRLYANDFAQAVADSRIRLAFLNACETARAAVAEDPARSPVAAALLQRGVP